MAKSKLKPGDTKKDRKGRRIYFKGYSDELTKKGDAIELWEPVKPARQSD